MRQFSFVCTLLLSIGIISSGAIRADDTHREHIRNFYLIATEDANQNTAVAVDVVFSGNAELTKSLATMPAAQYFEIRHQLLRDYPHQMMVVTWEIVPGQTLEEHLTDAQEGINQVFLFANYKAPGVHRMTLNPVPNLVIYLGRTDFQVAMQK